MLHFIKMKIAAALLICIALAFFWLIILGPVMIEFLSILRWRDIIIVGKASMIGIGSLPSVFYIFTLGIRNLLTPHASPVSTNTHFDFIVILISTIFFVTGFFATFILWIALALSPYIRCDLPDNVIQSFYVIDQSLCKTIDPSAWYMTP